MYVAYKKYTIAQFKADTRRILNEALETPVLITRYDDEFILATSRTYRALHDVPDTSYGAMRTAMDEVDALTDVPDTGFTTDPPLPTTTHDKGDTHDKSIR